MQKKEKSKKNNNDKLRMILDNLSIKGLSLEEKKYLISLGKRIKGQPIKDTAYYKKILGIENEKEIDPLKPRVTIHRRKERVSLKIPEAKKFIAEVPKLEEKKEIPRVSDKKEEMYEAEKIEVREPEFIEVKPKETLKVEKEKTVKETKELEEGKVTDEIKDFEDAEEKLVEWEPIDIKEEKIEEKVSEPLETDIKKAKEEKLVKKEKKEKKDLKEEKIDENMSKPVSENIADNVSEISFCNQCGNKIEGKAFDFCPACGSKLISVEKEQESNDGKKEIEEGVESGPSFIPVKKIEEDDELAEWKAVESDTPKMEEEKPLKEPKEVKEGKIVKKREKLAKRKPKKDKKKVTIKQKEDESLEWQPVETEIPKDEEEILFKEEIEKKDTEGKEDEIRKIKIDAFKDIKCIDEETAVLLFNNGFTSFDDLVIASLNDLKNVEYINNRFAKKIKKEIREILKERNKEKNDFSEYLIDEDFEDKNDKIINKKILEKKIEENEAFKDLSSINQKTAKLLYDNGITSIDILREASIDDLVKIRGVKRKLAKKVKKEIEILQKKKNVEETKKEDITYEEDDLDEWDYFDEEQNSESKPKKMKGYQYGDYFLYEKKLTVKDGQKRTVRFFSKIEPDEGEAIKLPKGYEVKENRKTGVPYLKKKK